MANKLDKISIITTFYNAEKFILTAVNSVLAQIVKGFEIEYVIVNDKSPDNSEKLINNFVNSHKHPGIIIRIIEPETNLGCGGARKFGIDNATGDYFMFLDADDYYVNTDFVYRAYNEIKRNHADVVEYGIIFNQPTGESINSVINQRTVITDYKVMEIALFKDNAIKFNVWSKIYTSNIVRSYPYSTSRTYEDVRTIPVWISNAKKVIIMPTPEINYRAASNSIIRENPVQTRLGTITAIAELFENPKFNSDLEILKAMYSRAMVDLEAILHNHSCKDEGFNEMSKLNTKMLSYIYPKKYQELTYNEPDLEDIIEDNSDVLDEDGNIQFEKVLGWETEETQQTK